jgi:hypothetical protein
MKLRILMLAVLSLGMSVYLLSHFVFIWQFGEYQISQPNIILLGTALGLIVLALLFSFYCIVKQINILNTVKK